MSTNGYFIGLMSGTSMDGLDAALVEMSAHKPRLVRSYMQTIPAPLRAQLEQLCQPQAGELANYADADQAFAMLCATAVERLLQQAGLAAADIVAIGSHGQTVRHQPHAPRPYTLQLGDPNRLAALTGIDVIADFRRLDMALGGEGAPLVPAFHQFLVANEHEPRALVNLGGIANVTWLPGAAEGVTGFDTGPANTLLDKWYQRHHPDAGYGYDVNGAFAAQGRLQPALLEQLLSAPFFARQPPKSTGRDDFNLAWLQSMVPNLDAYAPADVQHTLLHLTAKSLAQACKRFLPSVPKRLYLCGGGALNPLLLQTCQAYLPSTDVLSTAALGIEPEWLEAMAFAWLAWCHVNQQPGNLCAVTGARQPTVLGGWYRAPKAKFD